MDKPLMLMTCCAYKFGMFVYGMQVSVLIKLCQGRPQHGWMLMMILALMQRRLATGILLSLSLSLSIYIYIYTYGICYIYTAQTQLGLGIIK